MATVKLWQSISQMEGAPSSGHEGLPTWVASLARRVAGAGAASGNLRQDGGTSMLAAPVGAHRPWRAV